MGRLLPWRADIPTDRTPSLLFLEPTALFHPAKAPESSVFLVYSPSQSAVAG